MAGAVIKEDGSVTFSTEQVVPEPSADSVCGRAALAIEEVIEVIPAPEVI